jgi:hypothetical protein
VEAAVGLWLQRYATELEQVTRGTLTEAPAPRPTSSTTERRRLVKTLEQYKPRRDEV